MFSICRVCFTSSFLDKNLFEQLEPVLAEFMQRADSFELVVLLAVEEMGNKMHPEFVFKCRSQLIESKTVTAEAVEVWIAGSETSD